ncbi:MAG: hypothetical protein ABSA53_18230 [Streptosporangiaceae bacterium]|jgi:pullulanase/glycogen debranching enzyme
MTAPTGWPPAPGRATAPALPGRAYPLGATVRDGGTNFAVAAGAADGMLLCLFDGDGAETRVPLVDYDAGVAPTPGSATRRPSATCATSA